MVSGINRMVLATYGMSCPVIAAVTGHAIAGGLVLALCADLRVASLEGRYGLTEVKVGVPYPQAAIGVVRAELATHAARSLVLGNRLIDGREALRLVRALAFSGGGVDASFHATAGASPTLPQGRKHN